MAERDLIIRGGEVIDGSGAPRARADVRVRDGRIAEVGPALDRDGEPEIDAAGAFVTPGFIDTHAHTDPQVFWDPALDPDPLHGVTTMLVGNCSLSLYPVTDDTRSAISDLFAYIEDVPRHLFDDSVPWSWTDYAGYRDTVNASGTGINLAALVGHTPIRLAVMGDDAWTRVATPEECAAMAELLDAAMRAGAWGLSTSFLDSDADGRPVPSRAADGDEFDALLDVIARAGRGLVEVVPGLLGENPEAALEDLARRCGARGIPMTWTGFVHVDSNPAATQRWLDLTARLTADGVRLYPQLSPRPIDFRLSWDSSMMFMSMPNGWHKVIAARGDDKAALLRDPEWRATAREEWDGVRGALFPHRRLECARIVEVFGADNDRWLGQSIADVVDERGGHPSDAFADFVLANDCRPGIVAVGVSNADVDGVGRTLADPAVLVSSSDAGAHMQMLCASGDTTLLLTRHVRERGDFTLEEAVHELTGRQVDAFGFDGRGSVSEGSIADLVVFSLDELHYDRDEFVEDLPKGGARLRRPDGGYRATIVDGVPVQLGGELTGALPGQVISSRPKGDTPLKTYEAAPDIDVLTSDIPIPGYGIVPVNAFVLKGAEPMLVDTGAVIEADEFMTTLESVIDPAELRWLWLTHTDFDHIGCLHRLLDQNPQLTLITTFIGVGIMSLSAPLPMDRLHFLNPGEKLTVGDRTLAAIKPPIFDNPSTTGFLDESSGVLFSSDCFGALLQEVPERAADLSADELRDGQAFWAGVDSPWLHKADAAVLAGELGAIQALEPTMLLSSHLPAASSDLLGAMCDTIASVPALPPFVGPDQAALEQMLQAMAAGS